MPEPLVLSERVRLEPVKHIYTVDGEVKPSVSEILLGTGIVDPQWFTENGRWRGSAVHQAAWFDDENDLDETSVVDTEAFTRKEILGHVAGWRKFRRDTGFTPRAIEKAVCNLTLGYAGTPDRDGWLANGFPCLPDLKSGASSHATRFQTLAYAACYDKPRLFTRMEVRTKPNGDYTLKVWTPQDFARDATHWSHLVATYYLKKELRIL
jgi:hypothetical protein